MQLPFYTADVFTAKPYTGNPLAIVAEADDLSTAQMQIIAREFNLSETIFVLRPENPGHTARVRIFTPAHEMPFAGHPTIGCAIFLAQGEQDDGDFETTITLEEEAGLVPVSVKRGGGTTRGQLTAPVIPFVHDGVVPGPELAASALGLETDNLVNAEHASGLFEGGPAFLYLAVDSLESLAAVAIQEPHWSRMADAANVGAAYIYTRGEGDTDYRARMFAPLGIGEDPATGSATAILAAQLLANDALGEGSNRLQLVQGVEMGRPSVLGLEIDVADQELKAVRVSGASVPISEGLITAPE